MFRSCFRLGVVVSALAHLCLADLVPFHGPAVHQDPFIPGPLGVFAGGAIGPAAAGTEGEIIPPFSAGVPWSQALVPSLDQLASGQIWHWEMEIDVVGVVGVFPVTFFGQFTIPVGFGPGWDILIDLYQPDVAGSNSVIAQRPVLGVGPTCTAVFGEVGTVCKQFINLTRSTVAWGTAVVEGPRQPIPCPGPRRGALQEGPCPDFPGAVVEIENGPQNVIWIEGDEINGFRLSKVPEPATAGMIAIGLLALAALGRKRAR